MKYLQIPPPAYLKNVVQYFWVLESKSDDAVPKSLGPLADGCPGIIFQNPDHGSYADPYHQRLPDIFLYGQTVTIPSLNLIGSFNTLGVSFFPDSLKLVFGFDAHKLTDSCLDMNLLDFKQGSSVSELLLNAHSVEDQIAVLSAYLFAQISRRKECVDHATHYAVTSIVRSKGNISLSQLHGDLRLSERSFQRRFKQHVGVSPKLFAKICRFQASLAQIKNNNYTKLSDIAFDNGYADQPHFIRNFKEFAGFSPDKFQKQPINMPGNSLY